MVLLLRSRGPDGCRCGPPFEYQLYKYLRIKDSSPVLTKKSRGTNLRFIKKCLGYVFYTHGARHIRIDACLRASPYQALYDSTPLLLLPGSLARIPHRRASLFLIKLLWKRRKSRRGRSWGEAIFRRSKILHCSVYSALWLGGLRCQYRETNQTGCSLFGKKKKKKNILSTP